MTLIDRLGRFVAAALLPALLLPGAVAGEPAVLDGRWILVEQLYEGGGAGLKPVDPPLLLVINRSANGLQIVVHRGELHTSWPGLVTEEGPVPITLLERSENPDGSGVRVLWTARRSADERDLIEVEQALAAGAEDTLEETIRVDLFLDGEPRGGYTLTRRYEREGMAP